MESLNMNTLVKSLPSSSVAGAEQDLLEKFKGKSFYLYVGVALPNANSEPSGGHVYYNPLQVVSEHE